jgi:hypothetical protein
VAMSELATSAAVVDHLVDDLETSLRFGSVRFVLGDDYTARAADALLVLGLAGGESYRKGRRALLGLKAIFGAPVFDQVILFHLENKTELRDDAELTVAELGRPTGTPPGK